MKNYFSILLLNSCLIMSAQKNLEMTGTLVNNQDIPVESASVSIPAIFLRTYTTQEGKFNLSLANINYKMDDVIEISTTANDETVKITIGDFMKLGDKKIIINNGNIGSKEKNTTNNKETVKYTEARKTSLILNNIRKGNQISIKNKRGKIFYKELIALDNLHKKEFDLNYLKDDTYYFEIDKDSQISVIPFTISYEKGIVYLENRETTYFKPIIKLKNELITFSQFSPNRDSTKIDIYDVNTGALQLIYTETIEDEQDIRRTYKLEKGSFKFIITSNNNKYETLIDN